MAVGVLNGRIKFKVGERELTLAYRKLPFQAWGELKNHTSFTQKTLIAALIEFDLDAIVAVIWLERKQRERKLNYVDVYQQLQNEEAEFELLDVIVDGRSLSGTPDEEDGGDDEDPTVGS